MLKRSTAILIVTATISMLTAITFASPRGHFSQAQNEQKIREKIKKRGTGPNARVIVKLNTAVVYKGYIREANDTEFVLIDSGAGAHTVKYTEVRSVEGSGLSTAAKLAIGMGIGAGAALAVLAVIAASDN